MIGLNLPQLGEDMDRRREELFAELESDEAEPEAGDAVPADDIAISNADAK